METGATFARMIPDYPALVSAMRDRAEQMELARLELDRIAGLPSGYAGKLLSIKPVKTIGLVSLGPMLQTLGLVLLAVEDPAARDRTLARRTPFEERNRRLGNRCNPRNDDQESEIMKAFEQRRAGEPLSRAHLRVIQRRNKFTR